MLSRIARFLENRSPAAIIGTILLLEAIAFLIFLPTVPPPINSSVHPSYGLFFSDNYDLLGWNIAQGDGFRIQKDTSLTLVREPGYPFVLAALFKLFGHSITAARMLNLACTFVSAVCVSRFARQLSGSELAARIAPILFLLHPGMILAEVRGGVECLFIMLLLCFLALLFRALSSKRILDYVYAGLVLGVSANVRSTALLFPLFLPVFFFFWEKKRPALWLMGSRIAVVMAAAFLMLTPWIVRNYLLVQKFVPTASVAGVSTYAGYHICTHLTFQNTFRDVDDEAGKARGEIAKTSGLHYKPMANLYYVYFYDPHDELTFNSMLGKIAMDKYVADPLLLASCASKNLFHFWFSGRNWPVTALNMVVQLPYMVLGFWGLFVALRGTRRTLAALFGLFIAYTLCVYLPILAQARYSIHLIPLLAAMAALPLSRWLGAEAREVRAS